MILSMISISSSDLPNWLFWLMLLLMLGFLALIAGVILAFLIFRKEKARTQHTSREVARIEGMLASGKITAQEAEELKQSVLSGSISPFTMEGPDTHVKTVGIMNIVLGALGILSFGSAIVFGSMTFASMASSNSPVSLPFTILCIGLLIFVGLSGIVQLVTGIFVLKGRNWARIIGIVLAVFSLFHVPLGTLIGIYALWVLAIRDGAAGYFQSPLLHAK